MHKAILKTLLLISLTLFSLSGNVYAEDAENAQASEQTDITTMEPKSDFKLPVIKGFQNIYGKHQILNDALDYYDEEPKVIKGFYLPTDFAQAALEAVAGQSTKDPEKIEGIRRGLVAVTPRIFFYESRFNGHVDITAESFKTVKEQVRKSHEEQVAAYKAAAENPPNVEPLEDVPESDEHITTMIIGKNADYAVIICTTSLLHNNRVYNITAIRQKKDGSDDYMKVLDDTQAVIDAFKEQNKEG